MLTESQTRKLAEIKYRLRYRDERISVYIDKDRIYTEPGNGRILVGVYHGRKSPRFPKFEVQQFDDDIKIALSEVMA